jgi:hypothetical protein
VLSTEAGPGTGTTGNQKDVGVCSTGTSAAFGEQIKKARVWLAQSRPHKPPRPGDVRGRAKQGPRRGLGVYCGNGGTN